jgi:hypothetical protein
MTWSYSNMIIDLIFGDDLVILKYEVNDLVVIYIFIPILPIERNLEVGTSFGKVVHEGPLHVIRFCLEEMQYLFHN